MRLRILIVCSILLALVPAVPAFADDPTPAPSPSHEKLEDGLALGEGTVRAIVELTGPAEHAPVAAQAAEENVDVVLRPETQPFMVVEGTAGELAALAEDPRVTSIHRDRAYPPTLASSLKLIGADQAHAQGFTGAGQAVAVLDTGIDRDHPFFSGRIVAEACFSAVEAGVTSLCPNGQTSQIGAGAADAATARCLAGEVNLCEHGTHVAGIAAGDGGVAPGAGIVAIQVFSRVDDESICGEPSCLLAYESSLRLAMEHVAGLSLPVAAVNLSLGGMPSEAACDDSEEARAFKPAIDSLLAKGIATVVAAGNEYFEGVSFPACISSAVAVGANDDGDEIADFSNRGALLDLFAPGVDVESSVPDNQTAVHSGTSMATPHVAGALALLKAQSPQTPMPDLIEKLKTTGRPYAYRANDVDVITPRLDVLAALTGATPAPTISQTPAPAPYPEPDPEPEPQPEPQPGPSDGSPSPDPDPEPTDPGTGGTQPTPIPLPTVTVTVTVTASPPAPVCTRAATGKRLTAKQWAVEIHRSSGGIPDATLTCYLKLAQKASKVFPELTRASTLGTAYKVVKAGKTARQRLDSALLVGWLNWAHGMNNTKTLKSAETVRLSSKSTIVNLAKATKSLRESG
ncbi:S8 family serine peptidase [Nonomuraea sp. NPDC048916]|uniref:S8 family peptidase n=1 Tax=Nonomuraea sp. NPDC048916 TaxID=3154232 RepID=UPI0033D1BB1E